MPYFCQSRAVGRQQRTALGKYNIRIRTRQVIHKCLAQCRNKSKRASAKQYRSSNITSMRQGDDSLHSHGMKDGSGYIFPAHIFCDKVLDIGLTEYSTT